jgi:hypothetical protein
MKAFIVDFDDYLILYEDREYESYPAKYLTGFPNQKEIDKVNELYDQGATIIIHTGRNWDKYKLTKKQLKEFGIKHHELVMGKPQGYYIDPRSWKNIEECLKENEIQFIHR